MTLLTYFLNDGVASGRDAAEIIACTAPGPRAATSALAACCGVCGLTPMADGPGPGPAAAPAVIGIPGAWDGAPSGIAPANGSTGACGS